VHTGFGDSDLFLPRASPGYLKPLIERFQATSFVLLHCYPFVREAGWLAHVYANVYFDLSLTIPDKTPPQVALDQPARTVARRGQTPHQGDRPLPGETSGLTLVWAVVDLYITHATNGVRLNQLDRHRLRRMRYAGGQERPTRRSAPLRLSATGNPSHGEFTAAQGRDRRPPETPVSSPEAESATCASAIVMATPGGRRGGAFPCISAPPIPD
jgi:hypothetical protein